jgi:soluble lytic murein transglycosylase
MSSMQRDALGRVLGKPLAGLAILATTALTFSAPVASESLTVWEMARAELVATQPRQSAAVIDRWKFLTENELLSFEDYAGFVLANPDFPRESQLRLYAERRLDSEPVSPEKLVAFFDRHAPLTNAARARYALALAALNREDANEVARAAWRGGSMSETSEAYLLGRFASQFTQDDNDVRMEALLWHGEKDAAIRHMLMTSPSKRELYRKRLELFEELPIDAPIELERSALGDPGLVYNLVRYYRKNRRLPKAIATLADRPTFDNLPHDAEDMVREMLVIARGAGARPAMKIAASVDDLFEPGTDISSLAYRLRDDYTSLMWLGGTKALWELGDVKSAAPLFYRYGAAARTPQTRSKGFYWAGLASSKAGNQAEAARYWNLAAEYPDRFYGMLALEQLGREVPKLDQRALAEISPEMRATFDAAPLTKAVKEVAKDAPWRTGIQFYRAISAQAETIEEHLLVADLAEQTKRRDLAVNLGDAAQSHGHDGFTVIGYPTMTLPPGMDWTMVHAITRQESQFAQNAISHAGARGLMQLMPGTAREQAGKLGMNYMHANLIDSPSYNIQLGNGYFARMMDYYGGAYPLAIAAYNAGPGNVNKWLRRNGDPRTGSVSWIDWIEQIPIYETKNYVQRVIENAAVYEHLFPANASRGKPRVAGDFLN